MHIPNTLFRNAALLLSALLLCACAEKEVPQVDPGELQAVFFDVGKGDCILFSMGGSHLLIDAGYEETADRVVDALRERNVDSLDAMIITHYDKDHVGGAAEIAQQIPVTEFYLPDYTGEKEKCEDLLDLIDREGLQAVRVSEDLTFSFQEASVRIDAALVPYDALEENDNDASLLVEIRYGEDEWFLPGDIEKDAIDVWLGTRAENYDIVKMPHHGKKEKNSDELIEAVSPGIAVITDSPEEDASPKVLKNLEKNDVEIYRSSVNGTITITGNGSEKYSVFTEKQ